MPIYRYFLNSLAEDVINKLIPGHSAVVRRFTPRVIIDIEANSGDKADLDEILKAKGIGYKETSPAYQESDDIKIFLDNEAIVEDSITHLCGRFQDMQLLVLRREIYNDTENPIYDASVTPILGAGGYLVDHATRINSLETIHGKAGWHNQEVKASLYKRPQELLIYYGWLNSFNSGDNGWDNEKVAQDMAKYSLLVFGNGIQDPSHGDYANTQVIIPRIKALNPNALIFGYVSTNQDLSAFQTKVDQWNTLAVHGIFMDESGYDYGKTRSEFNDRVDYVHGRTNSKICMANAWNLDHVLGVVNDPSYPNTTYNPTLLASHLNTDDWCLNESFPINTTAYSGNGGYEGKAEWATRGVKAASLRASFNVNMAAVGIINNDNASGAALFQFGFISALQFSLEAFGNSDTGYGASSSAVHWWSRPSVADIGKAWSLNPSVQVDVNDVDVYWRFLEFAKLMLDFSSSAQTSSITKW